MNRTTANLSNHTSTNTRRMILSALFLALGLVLPFFTGQIPAIGNMLLPMHLPILLCGFVCGWQYGLLVGFITPLFRSMLFAMPPIVTAAAMAFELASYGLICGILYPRLPRKITSTYLTLICAMLGGRLAWGIASLIIYGIRGSLFSWGMFIAGAFLNAIPGIILQLILIPAIIIILEKTGYLKD